ncbi:hypothetical protein R1flu_016761 [Riccia fluitans]|uniref:Uncharacterized protein n=1 Tax=Riccia fluitans TaxID=41844 RepID=A0ABD1YMX3_9MARC
MIRLRCQLTAVDHRSCFSPRADSSREKEVFSFLNRASSRKLGDNFMVVDVASMDPKFGWWNVVDGAMLQRFSYEKPQSPIERWFRLEKKAAKVGKGLVKNKKGRKLVSQHWLEAIDPLHRYGHNLRFYFQAWCQSETNEPFFHWLDSGEGKDLDLEECSRETLLNERIRYLSPAEREQYEVIVEHGKLLYKRSREPVNSTKGDKWIFVMSTSGVLYVGKKERGNLQHSSFLAGAAITSAGRLRVKDGIIKRIEAHSGHYRPTHENFNQLISLLESRGADLSAAKIEYSSKEMMKSSKSFNGLQVDINRGEADKDVLQAPSTSQKSLGPQKSMDAADGQCKWGDEGTEEQAMNTLGELRENGNRDIFKREGSSDKEEFSELTVVTNLVTDSGRDQNGSGPLSNDVHPSTPNKADCRGTDASGVERVKIERAESNLKDDGSYAKQEQEARAVQEPLSLRDEDVMEENIEQVVNNHASA